jgi:peroxiredoxin
LLLPAPGALVPRHQIFVKQLIATLLVAALCGFSSRALAADQPSVTKTLNALIQKVNAKLQDGKRTEAELAGELKEFDALITENKSAPKDELAQVQFMKAMLYVQVFNDAAKGKELLQKLKTDYPGTKQAEAVDQVAAQLEKQMAAQKIQENLAVGKTFPDFNEKDLDGKPLSISKYKGKVVLVDFWATWCGPCITELPNVLAAYEKHHKNGFEIVGISLDQNEAKLRDFIKTRKMPWPQYFDGKGWQTKLAEQYGVLSIPATYLLDREGKIIGRDLRGDELEQAVAAALKKK